MYLRAVAAAARIGITLEPFSGETIHVHTDNEGVVHFDSGCHRLERPTSVALSLAEVHLHRLCTVCVRPYHFPDRIERYGQAVEWLQRAKFLAHEVMPLKGLAQARGAQQVDLCCRQALRLVHNGDDLYAADVERFTSALRKTLPSMTGDAEIEAYLDWAASLNVEPYNILVHLQRTDPARWRGRMEHARGELRTGGWVAFAEALGEEHGEVSTYRTAVHALRSESAWTLVEIPSGESEGDLLCWLGRRSSVERHGVCFAAVPEWVIETAAVLGAELRPIGTVHPNDQELIEIYADLSRTREGASALEAAKKLHRARRGGGK